MTLGIVELVGSSEREKDRLHLHPTHYLADCILDVVPIASKKVAAAMQNAWKFTNILSCCFVALGQSS